MLCGRGVLGHGGSRGRGLAMGSQAALSFGLSGGTAHYPPKNRRNHASTSSGASSFT